MNTTSLGLLERCKDPKDPEAWQDLQETYSSLIRFWVARVPGLRGEADDLVQDVLMVVVRNLALFHHEGTGSFRAWLRMITVNCIRSYCNAPQRRPIVGGGQEMDSFLAQLADPGSDLTRQWDLEHDKHVCQKLLAIVRPDFSPTTGEAFTRFALEERSSVQVASELGMTESAVVKAKARILERLRKEAGGLLD